VSRFVSEGLAGGESVVCVMSDEHWRLVAQGLDRDITDDAVRHRQLVVLDAAQTLRRISRGGMPDRARFDAVVGGMIRGLREDGSTVRAFGEMVDLLAAEGDFHGAERLEALWNELGESAPMTLLCGYSSASFGDTRSTAALRRICDAHSSAVADPLDPLGSYLLRASA